jgi:hypothetical protein
MFLANIFINNDSEEEFMVQVWDMDSKAEKIILYFEDDTLLGNDELSRTIINSVYDKYGFRIVTAIIINPAEMAIDGASFHEILNESEERDILFDLVSANNSKN